MVLGALGARTTAFKTVRYDEIALQHHGITVESFDLSEVFGKMEKLDTSGHRYTQRITEMQGYSCWEGVPSTAMYKLARLSVVLDDYILENGLDCLALRCWVEMEQQLHISPCVILSMLNERGIAAACEVDVCNAVMMHALQLASGFPTTCLDWNNNYSDEDDKCILFHCGPVPKSLMSTPGQITDHAILRNVVGEGNAFGCNVGRIKPGPITFASMVTDSGKLRCYVGEGKITEDPIAEGFFGCAGVAQIPNLQDVLMHVGRNGFRHHVSVSAGHTKAAMVEALGNYLGYDITEV
jgi:L-fucose isomerase-like protein